MSCCKPRTLTRMRQPRLGDAEITTQRRATINATMTVRDGNGVELLVELEAEMTRDELLALVDRVKGGR